MQHWYAINYSLKLDTDIAQHVQDQGCGLLKQFPLLC